MPKLHWTTRKLLM